MPRADYSDPLTELLNLGLVVRELRERKNLKQIEVATAAGMTESQVSDIERGKKNPSWMLLVRLVVEGLGASMPSFVEAYELHAEGSQ